MLRSVRLLQILGVLTMATVVAFESAPPTTAQSSVVVGGGTIADYAVDSDHVFFAVNNRVFSYTPGETRVTDSGIPLSGNIRRMAVSGDRLAAYLENAQISVVDLAVRTPHAVPSTLLPRGEPVTRISLLGQILAVGTAHGSIALIDTANLQTPALLTTIRWSDAAPGDWSVADLIAESGGFYAALHDSHKLPYGGAVVSLARDPSGQWVGSVETVFDSDQPLRRLAIRGEMAYIMTITDVLKVNTRTGAVQRMAIAGDSSVYPQAMTILSDQLYVLTYVDPLPQEREMTLSLVDISDGENEVVRSTVVVSYDAWYAAQLTASNSGVHLISREDVAFHRVIGYVVERVATRLVVSVAIAAAAHGDGDQLLVARERGLCGMDLNRMIPLWCTEIGLSAHKLLYRDGIGVGVSGRAGLYSVLARADPSRMADRLVPDDAAFSYIDAVTADDGILALLDVNPLRAEKTDFRIDEVSADATGHLAVRKSNTISIGPCVDTSIAAHRNWLGVLCGRRVVEYERADGELRFLTEAPLPADGMSIQASEQGLVAIGTSAGLVVYDLMSRQTAAIGPVAGVVSMQVVTTANVAGCVLAVHGETSGIQRDVVEYCEQGGVYHGEIVYRFERGRILAATSALPVNDGAVVVSGSGTAMRLWPASRGDLLYFPMLGRR